MRRLVIFGDGLTHPAKDGVSQHVISLLLILAKYQSVIEPILVMCDRGTIGIENLQKLPFKIILVPHATYYSYDDMSTIVSELKPDIIQTYSNYYARLILTRYSVENGVPLFMEHHDVDNEFARNYGLESIDQSFQKEVIEIASCNRTLSFDDETVLRKAVPHRATTFFSLATGILDDYVDARLDKKQANTILFLGNGAFPPNREAIEYITNVLAPKLPKLTFHIVGRLTDTIGESGNVVGHGMIDDLRPLVSHVSYGIAPLSHGSGLKTKNLTYLSAGMPVIGTPLSFRGYQKNRNFIRVSKRLFPYVLWFMVKTYSGKRAALARQYFLENYSEEKLARALLLKYEHIAHDPYVTEENSRPITHDDSMLPWLKEYREQNNQIVKNAVYIHFTQ